MVSYLDAVYILQALLLVIASGALLAPLYQYSHHVSHRRGIVYLSLSFLLLTVSYLPTVILGLPTAVQRTITLVSSAFLVGGSWRLAKSFLIGENDASLFTSTEKEGFGERQRN